MINIKDKTRCCGCNACYNICPKNCIDMIVDDEGFSYPHIDKDKCIECNLCEKKCPILTERTSIKPEVYGAFATNNGISRKSSSGGLFSVLSKLILEDNGIVYGAIYNKQNMVEHDYITSYDEINKLRGSKYVQSNINDSISKVKKHLKDGTLVLFSGTPCQIAGLKSYLGKEYDNLICIEIVCHGVPSPKIYKEYLTSLESKYKSKIQHINFREKSNGWEKYNISIEFEDGQTIVENAMDNVYMKGFLKDLYIRPSCFDCKFKNFTSGSDIVLGDLWGITNIDTNFYNKDGVSIVSINTDKGRVIFDKIPNESINKKVFDLQKIVEHNPYLIKSTPINKYKEEFYKLYNGQNLNKLVGKYTKIPTKVLIDKKIYNFRIYMKKILNQVK